MKNYDTLLKPGDAIRIRKDIKYDSDEYYMLSGNLDAHDLFIEDMGSPGELVVIESINNNGFYRIIDKEGNPSLYTYTDSMFDTELINILLEERLN